ncbi:UDP-2,4-diacetamido-2,4,6-trideoxy-beta-L-altropyranose hydrolase [Neobacillus sp. PS3-40]|uniref:UDP-2,4-diacetamido-2,4, 6-trideoxy-beta-L-altropyranose hydrolase n=1 Tax=Neobacillus sp. PS3-40 TaxID=3070679 RepID=UPI0027E0A6F5|nr:UDP-2,4-diacetamido-2,4,6-trideoxy-beta-L-altropyranose hydrolase [Neobacillus sp. PS3-40]WML46078.1 UDP-2,4-diacetamido-2,4,6-trideoxy-beta-L-altropyranose hydrolase [Neobacillus sp. PS3-40]
MNVYIRVDASIDMGIGHVMRCLTLAGRLYENGVNVTFVSRELKGHLCDVIEKNGFKVLRLPFPNENNILPISQSQWLGVPQCRDLEQTKHILKGHPVDLLIVDHYGINEQWERNIKALTKKMMVIDDLADRKHDCDYLLDQNYFDNYQNRYSSLVPTHCKMFLGPSYVLLRDEFYSKFSNLKNRNGDVRRIFIFYGGTDPTNETGKALKAFLALSRNDIHVDVVVGQSNLNKKEIKLTCASYEFLHFHCQVNNMAELMYHADLSIGAGGTTTWERCYLGLPSIVSSIAENQELISKTLGNKKIIKYLGPKDFVTQEELTHNIKVLIEDKNERLKMSERSIGLLKGNFENQQYMIKELIRLERFE